MLRLTLGAGRDSPTTVPPFPWNVCWKSGPVCLPSHSGIWALSKAGPGQWLPRSQKAYVFVQVSEFSLQTLEVTAERSLVPRDLESSNSGNVQRVVDGCLKTKAGDWIQPLLLLCSVGAEQSGGKKRVVPIRALWSLCHSVCHSPFGLPSSFLSV